MYYRSVNRGALLTPQGRYTIALIFALGLLAVGSGYNGIYLAFSLGISILIISGLLSEKVMRHFYIKSVGEVRAEAQTPFVLHFDVGNDSDQRVLYGVESIFLEKFPVIGRLGMTFESLARSNVIHLEPSTCKSVAAHFSGLPRGKYKKFLVLHRTPYPFGLLTKFKFTELETQVSILPTFDEKFGRELREHIHRRNIGDDKDRQFHSHRPFTSKDGIQTVDWKKSAGKMEAKWVVKVHESVKDDFTILLLPNWTELRSAPNSDVYEKCLSRYRTAAQVFIESGMKVAVALPDRTYLYGSEDRIMDLWVDLPKHGDRLSARFPIGEELPEGSYYRVTISQNTFQWNSGYATS